MTLSATHEQQRLSAMTEAVKLALYALKQQPFRHIGATDNFSIVRKLEAALNSTPEERP